MGPVGCGKTTLATTLAAYIVATLGLLVTVVDYDHPETCQKIKDVLGLSTPIGALVGTFGDERNHLAHAQMIQAFAKGHVVIVTNVGGAFFNKNTDTLADVIRSAFGPGHVVDQIVMCPNLNDDQSHIERTKQVIARRIELGLWDELSPGAIQGIASTKLKDVKKALESAESIGIPIMTFVPHTDAIPELPIIKESIVPKSVKVIQDRRLVFVDNTGAKHVTNSYNSPAKEMTIEEYLLPDSGSVPDQMELVIFADGEVVWKFLHLPTDDKPLRHITVESAIIPRAAGKGVIRVPPVNTTLFVQAIRDDVKEVTIQVKNDKVHRMFVGPPTEETEDVRTFVLRRVPQNELVSIFDMGTARV